MVSTEKTDKQEKLVKPTIKEAGGVYGWLLKKVKTFMWDAKTNTLILPQGVVLSLEERAALEEIIGAVKDEAKEVEKHRQMQMEAMIAAGIKYKANVVKGYSLLLSGSYRELTGVVAQKIHSNLQGMLMVNKRFLEGVWKVLASMVKSEPEKTNKNPIIKTQRRDGR